MNETLTTNEKTNKKVPIAVLCCFLIAFIVQGVLKLSGIFIFEKALDWQIFKIIDGCRWLQTIYYSIIMMITCYCLSVAFTKTFCLQKWYHYVIIMAFSYTITQLRMTNNFDYAMQIILDIIIYIIIPLLIKLTTDKKCLISYNEFNQAILTIAIQIMLYFCYLGLTYWSSLLTSLVVLNPMWVSSSCQFLVNLELYIGLITFALSTNSFVNK